MHIKGCEAGFTLIEMMITVAIIGILSSIAYPSYMEYVRRSTRMEARSILLENAQFLERNYTESNRYDKDSTGGEIQLPFTTSPKAAVAKYIISFSVETPVTASTYKLEAIPVKGGGMENDKCGTLGLDHRGSKTSTGASISTTECWK